MNPEISNEKPDFKVPKLGTRYVQAILLFFMFFNVYTTRSNLSMALVAMTDKNATENPNIPVYDWTNTNVILSSFNWTYIILQLPSGYFFKKFGVRWIMFTSMLLNNVATMLTPTFAQYFGSSGVIFCYTMQGLFQGFSVPCAHFKLGRWAPINERAVLSMIVFSGIYGGSLITMVLSGYISGSWLGWPATFYVFGALSTIWCVAWAFFSFDSPAEHPKISNEERKYIEKSLQTDNVEKAEEGNIPLGAILRSLPFWALVVANGGSGWGWAIIQSDMPTYMNKVLKYDMATNGLLSATPQITKVLINVLNGPICDFIVSKKYLSVMNARRLYQMIGSIVPAVLLIWLANISTSQKTLAVILLNAAFGISTTHQYGSLINHIDISPRYASVLVSIENSITTILCISAPLFVQFVVTDLTDSSLWNYVFLTLAAILVVTSTFFVVFGSADIQEWNFPENNGNSVKTKTIVAPPSDHNSIIIEKM